MRVCAHEDKYAVLYALSQTPPRELSLCGVVIIGEALQRVAI